MNKIKAYISFTKFRLSMLVILSALSGYLFAEGNDPFEIVYLMAGGLLVTAASNGSNQIWERELDKLMKRTSGRPIPQGVMSVTEGFIIVAFCLITGLILLSFLNFQSVVLGFSAYASYVFLYTPLKRVTPWAVFVGAFQEQFLPCLGQ